jgi:methyl-accepting chemotaxis protein
MTIRNKFLLSSLAGVLLPIIIIASMSVSRARTTALESFTKMSQGQIEQVNQTFSLYLNGLAEDAQYMATIPAITNIDESLMTYMDKPGGQMTPMENSEVERQAYMVMRDFGESHPGLAYVYLGTSTGAYLQWPKGESSEYFDSRTRPWYMNSIDKNEVVRVPAYGDTEGVPYVDYLKRFEGKNGVFGVVGVDVTLGQLTKMVDNVIFGESGYVMLVEDTGNVLADPSNPDNNFKYLNTLEEQYPQLSEFEPGLHALETPSGQWYVNVFTSPQLAWKFIGLVPKEEVYYQANVLAFEIILGSVLLAGLFALLAWLLVKKITIPMAAMTDGMVALSTGDGDLTKRLADKSQDETGVMARSFNRFIGTINDLVSAVKEKGAHIDTISSEVLNVAQQVKTVASNQSESIDQVSVAFNEMVATSNEVATNCTQAANAADDSQEQVINGRNNITETVTQVQNLQEVLTDCNQAMETLSEESSNITSILDTIKGIAEQTNLLALNAAIEAARAGEQGRGFAVVADEVRTLAQKTAESTGEIDQLLSALQKSTLDVSSKISGSIDHSEKTVHATQQTQTVFESIEQSVETIRNMTTQIATAAEQQTSVAEDINRNVVSIHTDAITAQESSDKVEENSAQLSQLSNELSELMGQFKT